MLTFTGSEEKQSQCFHLLGTAKPAHNTVNLITDNTSLISANHSLLAPLTEDTCSFSTGVSDSVILSFGEQSESCGSVAYSSGGVESCGSIASSFGGASCGAVSSSSGGCSYSC